MYKKLLTLLIVILPFLTQAQTEVDQAKGYAEDIHGMLSPLKFSDKLNIMVTSGEKDKISISAVDAEMKQAWSTTTDGFALTTVKFKGKILLITMGSLKIAKDTRTVALTGRLIDPVTGKITLEKEIYNQHPDYVQIPHVFTSQDGSFFKLGIRQTNLENKTGIFGNAISMFSPGREKETTDVFVMDFDENLNQTSVFRPVIIDDTFVGMTCNELGTLFFAWYKDGAVDVQQYLAGKTTVNSQVRETFDARNRTDAYFHFLPSKKNPDVLYMSVNYVNTDKDPELMVSKLDFVKKTNREVTETFTRSYIKEIEKTYVPVNKKLDKPFDLIGKYANVRMMREENDRLIVFISSVYEVMYRGQYSSGIIYKEGSMIIKGFDLDLNEKYVQFFPSGYSINGAGHYNPGSQKVGNLLYVVTNFKDDGALCGAMDITTGDWSNMQLFRKKKLAGNDYANGDKILWYPNGFILPYTRQRGMTRTNQDVSLVHFTY